MKDNFSVADRVIFNRLQEDIITLETNGYEWIGVFLQGSQNYNLAYENSDIDTKAIVLPKFEDVILNRKAVSYTHIYENNEHLDVKDIRLMFECFKKQNINFLEILFTDYYILNPKYKKLFMPMFENNEKIAHYNTFAALNAMCGMCLEKRKALTHPYPACEEAIKKWGYDPKQLHHILRLNDFVARYANDELYSNCLIPTNAKFLISVKRNDPLVYCLKEAIEIADKYTENVKKIKDDYMLHNTPYVDRKCEEIMQDVLVNIIRKYFK